jgi:hypothetical protein
VGEDQGEEESEIGSLHLLDKIEGALRAAEILECAILKFIIDQLYRSATIPDFTVLEDALTPEAIIERSRRLCRLCRLHGAERWCSRQGIATYIKPEVFFFHLRAKSTESAKSTEQRKNRTSLTAVRNRLLQAKLLTLSTLLTSSEKLMTV